MFRQLTERLRLVPAGAVVVFRRRYFYSVPSAVTPPPPVAEQVARRLFETAPSELQIYLDQFYSQATVPAAAPVPIPYIAPPFLPQRGRGLIGARGRRLRWPHLIYAYMIENTRVYEVFRRVLQFYREGERLGTPIDAATQAWLTATEQLFYSEPAPFAFTNVSGHVRPDMRANRRNVYQRMFGMELNHGDEDGKAYPFRKADAANLEFVPTLEEFLREVWVGISNAGNTSGAKPTDNAKIAELALKLQNMLLSRRTAANLSREEFTYVSMMSWFHLTLQFNSPIVNSLRAEADGPENRLFKIAERVGLPAHGMSRHFFEIADPMSRLLLQVEAGAYSSPANVPLLYNPTIPPPPAVGVPNPVAGDLGQIITHWTATTGRDVKARKVVVAS